MERMIIQRPLQQNFSGNQRLMNTAMGYTTNQNKPASVEMESYSVVVADDDRTMAELLATNLRRLGHRVVGVAWNGKEAVDMTLKNRPDVVVMDIHMPILDGIEAARQILGSHSVPIVMSTGMSDVMTVHRAIDLNLISYLVKPFSPAQLKVAVQVAVAQHRFVAGEEAVGSAA
jgi:response regulator NasT